MVSNNTVIVNVEMRITWKEEVVIYFRVVSQHLSEMTKENYKKIS
jgi:hypothetical protein